MFERPSFVHRLFEFLCDEVIAPFIEVLRNEVGPERVKAFANKHKAFVTAGLDATLLQKGPVEAIVEMCNFSKG